MAMPKFGRISKHEPKVCIPQMNTYKTLFKYRASNEE